MSDRLGYRVALTIASILGMIGWGIYTVAGSFWQVLGAEILLGISLSFVSGSDSALVYETLKARGTEEFYGRHEGRMNGFAQAGEASGAVFAGIFYSWQPLLPFIIQAAVWFIALLVTRSMIEPAREKDIRAGHLSEAIRTTRYAFRQNRTLRSIILLNSVLGLASFYPVWLIQPYMQGAGVPLAWFGPVWALANMTIAVAALASHRISFHLGDRRMILLFIILIGAGYLGLGLTAGVGSFLFYFLLTFMRGLRGPMMLHHAQRETPSANRASILSLQSLCFRLSFVCTGPLIGLLADAIGVQRTFHCLLYVFLIVLPPSALLFFRNLPGRQGERTPPIHS